MDQGESCNVGSATMSMHTGTHADAPLHFRSDGLSIGEVDLSVYIGPALVIDAVGAETITFDHLRDLSISSPCRILFRTRSLASNNFDGSFCYISVEAARRMVQLGTKLVGIDTPSVDRVDSKSMDTHNLLASNDISILENLALENVSPGNYELIALPLRLMGMDASPVRAVLRSLSDGPT